ATDLQPICPALVVQGACAASGADNEPCLDDRKADRAPLRITIDRRPAQNDCCAHDGRADFPRMNASKHCHFPASFPLISPAKCPRWNVSLRLAVAPRTFRAHLRAAGATYRRPQSRECVAVGYPGSKGERVQLIRL